MDRKNLLIAVGVLAAFFLLVLIWPKKKHVSVPAGAAGVSRQSAQQLYDQANALRQRGDMLEAKQTYREIVQDDPSFDKIEQVQKELEALNMHILFSNVQTPQTVIHEVKNGDTLGKIAKKYDVTVEFIKKSNNLRSDVIRVGQRLRIWTGKFSVFVDKSRNVLMLKSGEEVLKVYPVSTGANNSTPVGTFKVVSKLVDPVWFNRGAVVPPDSPQNVLGSRWMGFDLPGYGIHGTTDPETIGQQVTAGCVRMRNHDVEELYSLLPMGTTVVIVD